MDLFGYLKKDHLDMAINPKKNDEKDTKFQEDLVCLFENKEKFEEDFNFKESLGTYFDDSKEFNDDRSFVYVDVLDFDLDAAIEKVEAEQSFINDILKKLNLKKGRRLRLEKKEPKEDCGQVKEVKQIGASLDIEAI